MTATTRTVREIALEQPSSIRVFEQYGIDYCCGGRKPLAEACATRDIEVDAVIAVSDVEPVLKRSAFSPLHARKPFNIKLHKGANIPIQSWKLADFMPSSPTVPEKLRIRGTSYFDRSSSRDSARRWPGPSTPTKGRNTSSARPSGRQISFCVHRGPTILSRIGGRETPWRSLMDGWNESGFSHRTCQSRPFGATDLAVWRNRPIGTPT